VFGGVAVKDLDVVESTGVVSLQQERTERELYDEATLSSYEPRAVDAVRVDVGVLR